ncbi:ligase-associated DNA damage response endonuclease PdeM [Cellulophaga tyrosinoxydans]|uniref:Putative phosphoesterase n=1 Tax=Cellulophaga tyrosinoxydans TaxID=504486 RepID=A0A1W1YID5_9FLAO|nr:ligase-associated DNA damage response endonuclease PdeM [Cellulophaga tyrosinoxydans]SMC35929.1 putative phosphoesterase [Cellulophaga tyrosinoxydans]
MTEVIVLNHQTFTMHCSGALFWEEKSTLVVSDIHFGKVSHFRKHGAAVPQKAIQKNFDLLENIVHQFKPKTICFLGDLFHSSINSEWHLFETWVTKTDAKLFLIAGNHDIISPLKYEALGIVVISEIVTQGFLFTHHPEEREGLFNFAGHIHPSVKLKGSGKQFLKLACFFKSNHQMILPAFGEFTGTYSLQPAKDNEVYVITKDQVLRV